MRNKLLRSVAALALASLASAAVMFAMAARSDASNSAPPPRPPWVRDDGTIDRSKLPERIVMAGHDGQPLKDAQGRTVTVSSDQLLSSSEPTGPPPSSGTSTPGKATKSTDGTTILGRIVTDGGTVIENESFELSPDSGTVP
jgi:hypothetical protein